MKRIKQTLYFEKKEVDKFLRAIRLVGISKRYSADRIDGIVSHEKAHINKYNELGCQNKITKYSIAVIENGFICEVHDKKNLTPEERFKISLAPLEPSQSDFSNAIGGNKFFQIMKEIKNEGGKITAHNLRNRILMEGVC